MYFIFIVFGSNFDLVFKGNFRNNMVFFMDKDRVFSMFCIIIVMFVWVDFKFKLGILFGYSVE